MDRDKNQNDSFEQFISSSRADIVELARRTRLVIRQTMPDTLEQFDPSAHLIAYGIDRTYKGLICGIMLYKNYINLMFAQGTSLPDPTGLLTGTGKHARHVRITQPADLDNPALEKLLQAAIDLKKSNRSS